MTVARYLEVPLNDIVTSSLCSEFGGTGGDSCACAAADSDLFYYMYGIRDVTLYMYKYIICV